MFEYSKKNMGSYEALARMCLAICILAYAFVNGYAAFAVISLLIFHTAYKKYCFVYALFNINKKYSLENYYLSFIPKQSPSEVIVYDESGHLLFKNDKAIAELDKVDSLEDIGVENARDIIVNDNLETRHFVYDEKHYQVELKGVAKEGLLLAYFSNVTDIIKLSQEIEDTQREVIYRMGEIGESRSRETGNHVKRVALYSEKLALLYGLSAEEAKLLKTASPMHDIGKVAIPDSILKAPRKLTEDEFEVMKSHTTLGYDMLKGSNQKLMQAAAIVAHEHHEKFDGTGYPRQLQAEEIHIYGRITAIADVFDALLSKRVYKDSWSIQEVIKLLYEESGKQFDPKLIKLFIKNLEEFLVIHRKYS